MSTSNGNNAILKSKTGCLTCRKRRVKCDETLPACRKCQIGGRTCPGYLSRFTPVTADHIVANRMRPTTHTRILRSPSPRGVKTTEQENQAYDFYRSATAFHLAWYLDYELWYTIVLQYSQFDTAIHHAVTAVGYLSRHSIECVSSRVKPCTCSAYRSAITQYSKAVTHLQKQRTSDLSMEIHQMACALFVCIESLLGNTEQVKQLVNVAASLPNHDSRMRSTSVLEFFERLKIYFFLVQQDYRPTNAPALATVTPTSAFETIHDARRSIYAMIGDHISFVNLPAWRQGSPGQDTVRDDVDGFAQQRDLLSRFKQWREASRSLSVEVKASEAFAIMESHVTLAELWATVVVTKRDESAFDLATPDFASIISSASKHIDTPQRDGVKSPVLFNFELSWLTPLWYTALKCRNFKLRNQALSLLSCLPKQDGIWQGDRLIRLARRVVEKETESGELFQEVVSSPAYVEAGQVKFKGHYRLAESDGTALARTFSEVLIIDD